jgi:hypothetical protein
MDKPAVAVSKTSKTEIEVLKAKVDELSKLASKWQGKCHRLEAELTETRAKVYEIIFAETPMPADYDLKAQVMHFKSELYKATTQSIALQAKIDSLLKKEVK